jgi:hypothetical protein
MTQVAESSPERLRSEIEKAWQEQNESIKKTVESIIRIGELLLKVDAHFDAAKDKMGLLEFEESLPFTKSMASKYRHIAMNATLADRSFTQKLPPSIHSLYELSQVDPSELRKGLETGLISPEFQRSEIADYTSEHRLLSPTGTVGRPRKAEKVLYDVLLTLRVDRSVSAVDRAKLVDAISRLASTYSEVQCIPSRGVLAERLKVIRADAEKEFERLQKEVTPETHTLANLIDRAIESGRKNHNVVPSGWEWRERLRKELGLDVSGEVRVSDIFKEARKKEIISRFLPAKSHSQVIKSHILAMNYCDGKKSALKNLREIAAGVESKAKDKEEGQRVARAYLDAMPWAA